jgi:hypothetical protein
MKNLIVTLVFTAATVVASAQLANPSFETGDFTGWTPTGDAFVFSEAQEEFTGQLPLDGGFYVALFSSSSIIQTAGIHLSAGDTVSAWMNGSQGGSGSLDLIPTSGPSIHVPWTPVFNPGEIFPVRWNQISFTVQQEGIYSIGASSGGVSDFTSFLGVDLFTITPVPESSSYGLLSAVLGVAAIMRRRRKFSAAVTT